MALKTTLMGLRQCNEDTRFLQSLVQKLPVRSTFWHPQGWQYACVGPGSLSLHVAASSTPPKM